MSRLDHDRRFNPGRRRFLQAAGVTGAGLVIGFRWLGGPRVAAASAAAAFAPNAFVRIGPDDTVTVLAKHIEFGQGSHTGLATLLADELDADWATVRVENAPADAERYANLAFGNVQGTGGSTAIANSWDQLREAGATARAMLVAAAAEQWGVPAAEIRARDGVLSHAASGHRARFGELAEAAARQAPPATVTLKRREAFRLIGHHHTPRVDSAGKSDGSARFTLDVDLPDLLTAVIARPPRFGGRLAGFDDAETRKVRGVVDVVAVPQGVAVIGEGYWPALQGRKALSIEWDESAAETRSSDDLFQEYTALAERPGLNAARRGDVAAAFARAERVIEADYRFPYLAHAPLEPMDAVARVTADGVEVWAGSQLQTVDQQVAAEFGGVTADRVRIHTLFGGGSFGRRATPNGDVVGEAVAVARAHGAGRPVKVVWSREDDIQGGRYRPLYLQRLRAALDADGRPLAWEQRIIGQSILTGTPFEAYLVEDGVDATSVEGARDLPYALPNLSVEVHNTEVGVPVLWWRSVGHTHNGYTTETFIDELAEAAGQDPVDFRLALLGEAPRHARVLELAAGKARWGSPVAEGRARGVAVHKSFGSYVAQVVEVSRGDNGLPRVHRVVCAVDCGIAVNPHNIEAQMQSGIGYGLGAALYNEIVLEAGRPQQANFDTYRPLRLTDMPEVEVHVVASDEPPTGVGEPGTPPIAPAVANAWYRLTGTRVRRLPFTAA